MRVVAIANQKGGVAKTTTTLNIAYALKQAGARVLMVDSDPQGSLGVACGLHHGDLMKYEKSGRTCFNVYMGECTVKEATIRLRDDWPDIVPTTIQLAKVDRVLQSPYGVSRVLFKALQSIRSEYDFVLIDCPPTLGLTTINALCAATDIIIPCKTDFFAFTGVSLLLTEIEHAKDNGNPDVRISALVPTIFNASASHDNEVLAHLRAIGQEHHIPVYDPVHRSTVFDQASAQGVPTLVFSPKAKGLDSYLKIAEALYGKA